MNKEKVRLAVNSVAVIWWQETRANVVSYINMAIILGVINSIGYVAYGYMQARAIDQAVDRMMQPIERMELRIDGVYGIVDHTLNDITEITENAKKITGKIKPGNFTEVVPVNVKKAVSAVPQAKTLPNVQSIRDYWRKSAPEKKN